MTRSISNIAVCSAVVALGVASACSEQAQTGAGPSNGSGAEPGSGGANGTAGVATAGGGQAGTATSGGTSSAGQTGSGGTSSAGSAGTGSSGAAGSSGTSGTATEANLKLAFVGDTDDGSEWQSVLDLVASEAAQAVHTAGDMTYSSNPDAWWSATESVLGASYPIFLSRGNHDDDSWGGFLPKAAAHLGDAERIAGPHDAAYKTIFKGLSMVAIRMGDDASVINDMFTNDTHVWKICVWHQNMQTMQIGGKGDEMGWDVYEACRENGAIIVTGHEHSYQRTTTLVGMEDHLIDPSCSDGANLCVGPGRSYVTVTGLGGTEIRDQERCLPTAAAKPFPSLNTDDTSCPIWASIYTSNQAANYGAQFLEFNVDGDPKKARGYFKSIDGEVIDEFTITAD